MYYAHAVEQETHLLVLVSPYYPEGQELGQYPLLKK